MSPEYCAWCDVMQRRVVMVMMRCLPALHADLDMAVKVATLDTQPVYPLTYLILSALLL